MPSLTYQQKARYAAETAEGLALVKTVTSLLSTQGCEFECILPKKCIHQHDISVCNVHWDRVFYVSNNTTLTYAVNG